MTRVLQVIIFIHLLSCCYCNGPASGEALSPKDLSLSKALSWLLRHGAVTEGLQVNDEGFIPLEQVLQHRLFTRRSNAVDIRRVVTLSKNRFTLQTNPKTGIYEIRANSGHTFKDTTNNNQEVRALVKLNRGRPISQPGRSAKFLPHSHSPSAAALKNYNLPVGNILLSGEENQFAGNRPGNDQFMKYPELKKALSWILRYGAEKEGLTVKRHGYVPIEQILNHAYFKNKCMREDLITIANNEPHNFKLREGTHSKQIYIRARKEHPIKEEQEDWSVVQGEVYLPLGYLIHGINGSEWNFVSQHGLKVPDKAYLYFSPYEPADCWHTKGVSKYDDIYVYINAGVAMQDGIEFYRTGENSVTTKGDSEGLINTQYFKKVVEAKTGCERLDEKALENIFEKYGAVSSVSKMLDKPYAFIKFVDSSSVPNALTARICIDKRRIFVRKYTDNSFQQVEKDRPRNHSEGESDAGSKSKQPDQSVRHSLVGIPELEVQIPDPSECPEDQNLFDWIAHQIISQIELPDAIYEKLNIVKADMENLLQPTMPGCSIFVFGSCGSGLAFKHSDVDLFVQAVGKQPERFVQKEAKALYRSELLQIKARISMARVPIVKLRHLSTGWDCDVTAHSSLGVSNSQLIRFLTSLDKRVRPLVMLVKYWAKVCNLTGNTNMFSTYSLVMLVVFFLQQVRPPILPSIAMLQELADAKNFERGWECSYCDSVELVQKHCPSECNTMTLKQLLTEFFRFYHSYDYEQVICPLLGRPVELNIFENVESLPPEMKLYEENKNIRRKNTFQRDSLIRTQDPFELCLNITRNLSPKICQMLRNACKLSHEICENTSDELLLEKLFSLREEFIMPPRKSSWKIHIEYTQTPNKGTAESELLEWYKLTTDAVFLVMREILKVDVTMKTVEICQKVQKTEGQQDVHTLEHSEDNVYVCTGLSEAWRFRKKALKLLNQQFVSLTPFEKEICLSNFVHKTLGEGDYIKDKSFNLVITSYDNFKQNCKGIDLTICVNTTYKWTNAMGTFIRQNLHRLVMAASNYLQINGGKTKELLKDIADAMSAKAALEFETVYEEEDPDIIAQKRRIKELEKQSLLLESLEKNNQKSSNTSESQNFSGIPGPSVKCETGCKPMVINMSVGNRSNVRSMKPQKPCSSSNKQNYRNIPVGKSSFNSYCYRGPTHYKPRPQFRFPQNRCIPFSSNQRDPALQRPCDQQQYSAYEEGHGHNYNNDMSRPSSSDPDNKRYGDNY